MGFQEASVLREGQKALKAEHKKALGERLTQPLVVVKKGDGTADITIGAETQNLAEGEWSDWYHLSFELNSLISVSSITRVKLVKLDEPHFELFVNTLDIDPEDPIFWQPISQPTDFAGELARISGGPYETIGWGCVTMPFKDKEIDVETFLEDVEFTLAWRERVTYAALERADFDVLFSGGCSGARACRHVASAAFSALDFEVLILELEELFGGARGGTRHATTSPVRRAGASSP